MYVCMYIYIYIYIYIHIYTYIHIGRNISTKKRYLYTKLDAYNYLNTKLKACDNLSLFKK